MSGINILVFYKQLLNSAILKPLHHENTVPFLTNGGDFPETAINTVERTWESYINTLVSFSTSSVFGNEAFEKSLL